MLCVLFSLIAVVSCEAMEIINVELRWNEIACAKNFDHVSCGGRDAPANQKSLHIFLHGNVEIDDHKKVAEVVKKYIPDRMDKISDGSPLPVIHLNSPGGSLVGGVQLADLFHTQGYRTWLDDDAACASACAIAFMHGTIRGLHDYLAVSRIMRPTATLGFHAPFVIFDVNRQYDGTEVATYQEAASLVTSFLLSLSDDNFFPKALMSQMYRTPADKLFRIDTVDEAGRNGILVDGRMPKSIGYEQLAYACLNTYAWKNKRSALDHSENEGTWSVDWEPGRFDSRRKAPNSQGKIRFLENGWFEPVKSIKVRSSRLTAVRHTIILTPYDMRSCVIDIIYEKNIPVEGWISHTSSPNKLDEYAGAGDFHFLRNVEWYHPRLFLKYIPPK